MCGTTGKRRLVMTSLLAQLLTVTVLAAASADLIVDESSKADMLGDLKYKTDKLPDKKKPEDTILSWHAVEEILELVEEIGNVTNVPAAIYRDDLPSDYVAYWLVEFNSSQYAVVSAGAETGDHKLATQGPLPSPIKILDLTAKRYGKKCLKYLMLSPGGEMMCRDSNDNIVATTAEELLLSGNYSGEDPHFEHAHEYIEQQRSVLAAQWAARAVEVAKASFRDDGNTVLPTDTNDVSSYTEIYVRLGGLIRIPVDEDTVSVKVRYCGASKIQSATDSMRYQAAVCRMLSSCSVDDNFSFDLSQRKTQLQLSYVEIAVTKIVPALLIGKHNIEFELRVQLSTGEVIVKHYSLDLTPSRQKRSREYTSYTSWHYCSIPDEWLFPYYWQHLVRPNCPVGCGPVAWAMIFAYYDRRSHSKTSTYGTGSQDLYRCDSDGTTGSKTCVAPQYPDARSQKYTEHIAKTIGTWCMFENGATPAHKMDHIQGFFQARQKSGNPKVQQTNNVWRLIARDSIAVMTRYWICRGWPVLIGTTEGSPFKWHYPVATKFKSRSRKWRRCIRIWRRNRCFRWHTDWDIWMFTHQGGQNPRTQWRRMSLHYAAIASY